MKNKLFLSLTLCSILSFNAFCQTYVTQVKPAGSKTWGYANLKGELIIPAQYAKCYKFSKEGLAPIYDTEKRQYYFINLKGETLNTEISGFKLIDAFGLGIKGFDDGLVPVKDGAKWGYLNTQGKMAIPAKYDDVSEFNDQRATAKVGTKILILDTKGTEIPVDAAGIVEVRSFSEKLAPYRAADKKFGFIGTDGKVTIPAQFESVGYFNGGLAWAKTPERLVGYINTKGEWVIKAQFLEAKNFDPAAGMARVKTTDNSWGYVNKTGEIMYVSESSSTADFSEGLAYGKKDGKVGFYDNKGKWVIAPQFDAVRDFVNGYAAAKQGLLWGIIDKEGKWVIQPTFEGIKDMELVK